MKASASEILITYSNNDYSTVGDRIELLDLLGLDPYGTDDAAFGVSFVYCGIHLAVHAAGECTVGNEHKLPLAAFTTEEASAEAEIRICFCPVSTY